MSTGARRGPGILAVNFSGRNPCVCCRLVGHSGSGSFTGHSERQTVWCQVNLQVARLRFGRGVGGWGGLSKLFGSWLISGLIDRKLWIGWFGTCVCRELVPAPTALAAPALWCSFLKVHATAGPSAGTSSALRLVFRQLLGCLKLEEGKTLLPAL